MDYQPICTGRLHNDQVNLECCLNMVTIRYTLPNRAVGALQALIYNRICDAAPNTRSFQTPLSLFKYPIYRIC